VIEQPAVFRNNDLPGVMLASAASNLLLRYRVAPGLRVVVVAGNLEAYRTALGLHAQNVRIVAIVDLRADLDAEEAAAAAQCAAAGMAVHQSHAPYEAIAGADGVVVALDVAPLVEAPPGVVVRAGSAGRIDAGKLRRIECDSILMSVGWAAAANLLLQAGATTRFSDSLQQFIPSSMPAGIFASGRLNGVYDFDARVADGARAGSAAAAHAGFGAASDSNIVPAVRCPSHPFPIIDHPQAKNFVDFDEDLQVKDLENAAQEGFDSSELLKRYSTVGMGPSQGKHSNMNALRVLARYRGVGVERLGLTTSRPMYHPVPLKTAGRPQFQRGTTHAGGRRAPTLGRGLDAGRELAPSRVLCGLRRNPRPKHRGGK